MSGLPFHIVDVFAQGKYTGNQLAVVRDARQLDSDTMQRVAREMNYSETTFITNPKPTDDGYRVRIFTPQTELAFAGHPTLGTASIIREFVSDETVDELALNLDVGSIPVSVERDDEGNDVYWMTQQPPAFGAIVDPDTVASVVTIDREQLDSDYEPRVVSTGLPTLLVPTTSLDAVEAARPNSTAYQEFVAEHDMKAVLVFSSETVEEDNDLHVRMFAPALGVPADPATGSGNGCLAGYLARYRYFGTPTVDVTVEQGYEVDRPSLLRLEAEATGGETTVSVGGRVIHVADGVLH